LQRAGVEFAILGDAEVCTGDAARRAGNEYQFQIQAIANVETLNARTFKRIVTLCPHCMNTLKNEYGDFGGHYEVLHHSELLAELIAQGRLPKGAAEGVVFHDPCYLGRHNDQYDAPRAVLAGAGAPATEMERARDRSFCCGGGGAFGIDPPDQRINALSARQSRDSGAATLATACPFCLLMLEDGAKAAARAAGEGAKPQAVRDIAEILADALPAVPETPAATAQDARAQV
jgi:Fe-S oxidoreductase